MHFGRISRYECRHAHVQDEKTQRQAFPRKSRPHCPHQASRLTFVMGGDVAEALKLIQDFLRRYKIRILI
jgi:hypothetical protein